MANTREIVKRRKAVRNVRKITRTMELIATARFKKALDRATEAEAYTRKIAELAADLTRSAGEVSHPLLEVRPQVERVMLLVVCSNRGLCGGYNANILREANRRIGEMKQADTPFDLQVSGKRGITFFRYQGVTPDAKYTHFEDKPQFLEVEPLADTYIERYVTGAIDRLDVAYMRFDSAARQTAVVDTLLPLASVGGESPQAGSATEYEFTPTAADILNDLVPEAFKARLFKCFLDAAVSEQIARRVAMKAATENAGDLIKSLSRQYNRARQAQITKEIAEIIGGAEALSGD